MKRVNVKSSHLKSVGFDVASRVMEVEFASGDIYQYVDVPIDVFASLVRAPSKGGYFEHFVSERFVHRRVRYPET